MALNQIPNKVSTFAAYRTTSAQSIAQNTWVKVQLNGKLWDSDNAYDNTTNYRWTPKKPGYYQINARLNLTADATATIAQLTMWKNGSAYSCLYRITSANTQLGSGGSTIVYLNGSTDYIEFYINMAAATTRTVNDDIESIVSGIWIGN